MMPVSPTAIRLIDVSVSSLEAVISLFLGLEIALELRIFDIKAPVSRSYFPNDQYIIMMHKLHILLLQIQNTDTIFVCLCFKRKIYVHVRTRYGF